MRKIANFLSINFVKGLQLLAIWLPVNRLPGFVDHILACWFFSYCFFICGSFHQDFQDYLSTTFSSTSISSTIFCWPAYSTRDLQYQNSRPLVLHLTLFSLFFVLYILAFYLEYLFLYMFSLKVTSTTKLLFAIK